MVNHSLIFDLIDRLAATPAGSTTTLALPQGTAEEVAENAELIATWCRASGNELVEIHGGTVTVRHGRGRDVWAGIDPDQIPGTRLWMYVNFDCNLHCDYCCVKSSPKTDRKALGVDRVARLAAEAEQAGVSELIVTGGEPFLLNDIAEIVASCSQRLPTTLLTNGMLLRGGRLERLRAMDRDRVTLQISLDSATPELHNAHRGPRAWERAVEGIRTALGEGFGVKVAATLPAEEADAVAPFLAFLAELGIREEHRLIRAVAKQGFAETGVELHPRSLIPEVTITAEGVWWHPVSAVDDAFLVRRDIFPLASAIAEVKDQFARFRADMDAAADWFPCA